MMLNKNNSGGIMVEGAVVVFLLLLVVVVQIELIRRVWVQMVLQSASCEQVRKRVVLDKTNHRETRIGLDHSISTGIRDGTQRVENNVLGAEKSNQGAFQTKLSSRYPSFLIFSEAKLKKNHFEVTEECRFPYLLQH
jgi:Na+-transporting methylmalonyl-CoA/oxaloacetate decarboxylase gamma subunit